MSGSAEFRDGDGMPANVTIGGQTNTMFSYVVAPRSSQKLATSSMGSVITSGSVRINPSNGGPAPVPLVIFSYKPGLITLSEAGVGASSGTAFRMYVESAGSIQSGVAIANANSDAAVVTLELTNLDGSNTGLPGPATLNLPAYGHVSQFLSQLFTGLPNSFKGIVRVSTSSAGD